MCYIQYTKIKKDTWGTVLCNTHKIEKINGAPVMSVMPSLGAFDAILIKSSHLNVFVITFDYPKRNILATL